MCPCSFSDLVDGNDVRVVERGGGARLLPEAAHPIPIICEALGEQLECDLAPKPDVVGKV